jgi:ATP:corrinoid adenosyltransferase
LKDAAYDNMRDGFERGYVQVYTGNGKGKTTAGIGLVLRALGAGLSVFYAQFIKGAKYSEIEMLERLGDNLAPGVRLTCKQYGQGRFIMREPAPEEVEAAREGLREAREAMKSGEYQLVVLDEANVAAKLKLFAEEDLLALIDEKPEAVELVLTGRGAGEKVIEAADLVTEMREIKHYYQKGVKARRGIES